MDKLRLSLPNFNYTDYVWFKEDNVTVLGRADDFEKQNLKFLEAGYTSQNSFYYRTHNVDGEVHDFCRTLFPRFSVGILQQPPGQTLPSHVDTFFQFAKNNNVDPKRCCRINVFLEDWKSGHYFEINKKPFVFWECGDAIIIHYNEQHLSGNMGLEPKYTMQITGIWDEFTGC